VIGDGWEWDTMRTSNHLASLYIVRHVSRRQSIGQTEKVITLYPSMRQLLLIIHRDGRCLERVYGPVHRNNNYFLYIHWADFQDR
jgi:hypothetical protein